MFNFLSGASTFVKVDKPASKILFYCRSDNHHHFLNNFHQTKIFSPQKCLFVHMLVGRIFSMAEIIWSVDKEGLHNLSLIFPTPNLDILDQIKAYLFCLLFPLQTETLNRGKIIFLLLETLYSLKREPYYPGREHISLPWRVHLLFLFKTYK